MITTEQQQMILDWAKGGKTSTAEVLQIGDSLKNCKKGKKLAILTPSYLLRKIDYQKLIDSDKIDTMTVNKGYLMPGTENCEFYLPFTTHDKTMAQNKQPDYVEWLNKFKGLAMHGIYMPDPPAPYILASLPELQYIAKTCSGTKFTAWRHAWGPYLNTGHMTTKMCEFPYYKDWTPSKIPWGHCGAISGFAIPLAMTLGYKEIYVIGMGYEYVSNDYHTGHEKPLISHKTVKSGSWYGVAPTRFANQNKLAKSQGIKIAVGPVSLTEKSLLTYFQGFDSIDDLIS